MKFTEILNQLGIEYVSEGHEHCRRGWIQLDCPQCSPNAKRWRLGYNLKHSYLNCWLCGSMRIPDVLMELSNRRYGEIKAFLTDLVKEKLPDEIQVKGKLEFPKGVGPLHKRHLKYLTDPIEKDGRGFSKKEVKVLKRLWDLQGIGFAKELSWRLFLPIVFHGQTVSWTTRSILKDHALRYRSADQAREAINHRHLLYGEDYARNAIIIVEGPIDCWKIGPGAVCTFGTGYTTEQFLRMLSFPIRAVCFDDEPAAQLRAKKLCRKLSMHPGRTVNITLDAKDPGSANPKEISRLRETVLSE